MYDCVYPTRTARFGTALVPQVISIKLESGRIPVKSLPYEIVSTFMMEMPHEVPHSLHAN